VPRFRAGGYVSPGPWSATSYAGLRCLPRNADHDRDRRVDRRLDELGNGCRLRDVKYAMLDAILARKDVSVLVGSRS
jgi:hypothetical protein